MCSNLVPGSVKRHWYIIEFSLMTNSTLLYHYNIWMCLHLIAKSYLWLISASDSFSVGRHRIICANSFHWCVYPHLGHHNLLAITSAHHFLLWLQILQQFPRSYRVSSSDLPQLFLSGSLLPHSTPFQLLWSLWVLPASGPLHFCGLLSVTLFPRNPRDLITESLF